MVIPNAKQAIVDLDKLTSYCLNPEHTKGKHKARLFASILGLSLKDAPELQRILRKVVEIEDATIGLNNEYGQRYIIDFQLSRSNAVAIVRSCWIIRPDEDFPRLTNCYILRSL